MKQVKPDYNFKESIVGKTIKGVSFIRRNEYDYPQFILTFTDDTYIFITAQYDPDGELILDNGCVADVSTYNPGALGYVFDGKFEYYHYIQDQIDLGLIKGDKDLEFQRIKEAGEYRRKQEYEFYLKLKEKYESK